MNEQAIEKAAQQIRAYLAARPQAADTLEGIHRWWIDWQDQDREESPAVTLAALEQLAAGGELEKLNLGGRNLWRRAG
ncbi:hypothetical protein VX159_05350 [Dechloromonas sp. ZY10]|uniref:hypothetical protein n=1 Tax=Dechloromonas aquae TaxID=2664436 RepID=UPI003526CB64